MQPRIYWILISTAVILAGCNAATEVSTITFIAFFLSFLRQSFDRLFRHVVLSPNKFCFEIIFYLWIHRTRVPASIRTRFTDFPVKRFFEMLPLMEFLYRNIVYVIDASRFHTYSLLRTCSNFKQQHHDAIWSRLFTLYCQLHEFVYSFYRSVFLMR